MNESTPNPDKDSPLDTSPVAGDDSPQITPKLASNLGVPDSRFVDIISGQFDADEEVADRKSVV